MCVCVCVLSVLMRNYLGRCNICEYILNYEDQISNNLKDKERNNHLN